LNEIRIEIETGFSKNIQNENPGKIKKRIATIFE
jgi:hypothetical protein